MNTTVTRPLSLTLTIPGEPAYALSPNSRAHHMAKYRATQEAHLAVRAALGDVYRFFPGPVRLAWTIYLAKGRRRMDHDQALTVLKAHTDALVRQEVIVDDSPKWIPTTPTVDQVIWSDHRGDARIECTITEAV